MAFDFGRNQPGVSRDRRAPSREYRRFRTEGVGICSRQGKKVLTGEKWGRGASADLSQELTSPPSKKLLPTPANPYHLRCFVNILETLFCFPANEALSLPTSTQESLVKFLDPSSEMLLQVVWRKIYLTFSPALKALLDQIQSP